jgi:hypothetical protein
MRNEMRVDLAAAMMMCVIDVGMNVRKRRAECAKFEHDRQQRRRNATKHRLYS